SPARPGRYNPMTTTIQQPSAAAGQSQAAGRSVGQRAPDPRYIALRNFAISISVFNIFGYTLLGFEQPWLWAILSVATAYATDIGLELISARARGRPAKFTGNGPRGMMEFLLPAHITGLACNMLLYANNQFWPVLLAVVIAISQKHFLQAPI